MKRTGLCFLVFFAVTLVAFADGDFDKIKSLAGEWEARTDSGDPFTIRYRLVSNETAVLETIEGDSEDMTTIYYLDGDHVMMTHFCAENNQPRMKSTAANDEGMVFQIVDVTNLPDANTGHMIGLALLWKDDHHVTQEWTYRKEAIDRKIVFSLTRKPKPVSLQRDSSCTDFIYSTPAEFRPQFLPINSSSGISRWEQECTRREQKRSSIPKEETECTCRKCTCK